MRGKEKAQGLGAEAAEEGADTGAGAEAGLAGLSTCGSVARFCAAGSLGNVNGPFCPQAASMSAQPTQAEPTISLNFNML
jgi:hypothetical protein